jgi:hypothetical protein
MGIHYTNIALYGPDQKAVADHLVRLNRIVYVSPTVQKFTVVYDKEMEDQDPVVSHYLTSALSSTFVCPALATSIIDGDVFLYWLYNAGELVDEYDSAPGYFDAFDAEAKEPLPPTGGDARKLCAAFKADDSLANVQRTFQLAFNSQVSEYPVRDYLKGEDIHRELAKALGMPLFVVKTGYYTIENGFLSNKFDKATFQKCEPLK